MVLCKISRFPTALIVILCLEIQLVRVSCKIDNCTFPLNAGIGSIQIPTTISSYQNYCKTIVYEIKAKTNTSIINITSSSYIIHTNTSSTPIYPNDTGVIPIEAPATSSTRSVYIVLEEISLLQDGAKSTVVMEKWDIRDQNFKQNRMYLSRTSYLRISVYVTGDWMEEGVELSYKELEFDVFNVTTNKEKGEANTKVFGELVRDRYYRPHSAYFYQIQKSQNMNVSSISMTLNYLDIDEGVGEYLLIGAGDIPFHGSPPLFISNKVKAAKKYKINDEKAYIVFVAASTRKVHKGFSIKWRHDGTKITGKDDETQPDKDDILQSLQVCIYNHKAALIELEKPKEDQFKKFRQELATTASKVAEENLLPTINTDQISFYRLSAIDSSDKFHKEGLLYVMLKIEGSEKGKAAFDRALLEKSFNLYNSSLEVHGYKIGSCPTRKPMSSGFYAMVPIFCCFLALIWVCKQKPILDYITRQEKEPVNLGQQQGRLSSPVADNFYSTFPQALIVPAISLIDEQGRRLTLNYNDTVANFVDDDSKFGLDDAQGRPSRMIDSLKLSRYRNRIIRAEINEGFEEDEESCSAAVNCAQDMVIQNETENVYDTLKSCNNEACDTRL